MKNKEFWLIIRQHLRPYVNARDAGASHAVYIRDNELSEEVSDELMAIYVKLLSSKKIIYADIRHEVDMKCRGLKPHPASGKKPLSKGAIIKKLTAAHPKITTGNKIPKPHRKKSANKKK
jgi:hypothetical protein